MDMMKSSEPRYEAPQPPHVHGHAHHPRMPPLPPPTGQVHLGSAQPPSSQMQQQHIHHNSLQRGSLPSNGGINGVSVVANGGPTVEAEAENDK
ncbi:Uncharacterized protein FKW44_000123, partial [Caligus rogercresseyi]